MLMVFSKDRVVRASQVCLRNRPGAPALVSLYILDVEEQF